MAQPESPQPQNDLPLPPFLQGEDKRSIILRAAHRLFLDQGFSVTTMDAVTQEAGVSKATVYAHFKSKHELFETLLRLGSENSLSLMPPIVRKGGKPRDELFAFFGPFLRHLFEAGAYKWTRMVTAEAERHPENAQLFYRCTIERITSSVEAYFQQLAAENLFPSEQTRRAAEALVAVVLLGPMQRVLLLGPGAVNYQENLEYGLDLVVNSHGRTEKKPTTPSS